MTHYRKVIIETYKRVGGGSAKNVRARPIHGQGLDASINVECSARMRDSYPIGTKFLLDAKLTAREEGTSFLYAHHNAPYTVLNDVEATEFLNRNYRR